MELIINYIADFLWDWPLIVTILSTGIYYTLTCKYFQIKYFKHICKSTFGSSENTKEYNANSLTTLETFFTVIATTLGIGNITGVATAISLGGAGALFWMIITGMIGMIIKMAEVTLAVYYRDENEDGSFDSGPMQYIEKGIGVCMNFGKLHVPIAIFCIGIMSTLFITIQNYHASVAISGIFNMNVIYIAFIYLVVLYYAIYKGIKAVSKIFKITIPIISLIYIGSGILVVLRNLDLLLPSIKLIILDAFDINALFGGIAGKGIAEVVRQGVSRAVYSNEAGWGTTPMIHAKANTDHPIKIGFLGAIEVFFDTIIICFTTGVVVVISMVSGNLGVGDEIVIKAFSMGIGNGAKIIIPTIIFLFGLTTSIGWYSYYETIFKYIHKRSKINVLPLIKVMKYIYPLPGFFMVLYVSKNGAPGKLLWAYSDILAGLPTFINIFAVLILSNKFFDLLEDYELRYIKKVEPEERIPIFFKEEDDEYYNF
ncbi:alanine/glycine:cation symporter family protein [Crassaminicella indica]|uniref:Amino acid carrier protein n=1 Tax=Crassaminicella indica TaxID=2855394 RepID=A0ABX8R8S2_9CLOT|nr:amino acid carrier protein [Crassaminicella indica]QXM05418.1 amino acid carrier protein [Crassaminicella indica]